MKLLWKLANAIHLGLYRLTSGRIGGRMGDGTILLLTTTGRKSGKARTVPVLYFLDDNGNPVVTASNAGLLKNPAWFENLRVNSRVTYQIDAERKVARADIAPPELRDRLWTRLTTNFKGFLEYQKKTPRVIPMVTLRPVS
jgi:F420H(2)-dependent quinone reductase